MKRLKSRHRQKAQNARAGIKLITDMSVLNRNGGAAAGMPTKFVDAVALKALEGDSGSTIVGKLNWSKRDKCQHQNSASAAPQHSGPKVEQELSPEDRPIVIGITLPCAESTRHRDNSQTVDQSAPQMSRNPTAANQTPRVVSSAAGVAAAEDPVHRSVWSPDTPDTVLSFHQVRETSSSSSQSNIAAPTKWKQLPPVPGIPTDHVKAQVQDKMSLELGGQDDEEDSGTPCTLFEEDGPSTPGRPSPGVDLGQYRDSANSGSAGWWDHHVITPFVDQRNSFSSRKLKMDSPKKGERTAWAKHDSKDKHSEIGPLEAPRDRSLAPIARAPIPRKGPTPRAGALTTRGPESTSSPWPSPAWSDEAMKEGGHMVTKEGVDKDLPPPYSSPKNPQGGLVRHRAIFPPEYAPQGRCSPSAGTTTAGHVSTIASREAAQPTGNTRTVTSNPSPPPLEAPLPPRPLGTYLQSEDVISSHDRARKVERQRRRHEKEEVVARRLGGFWRGRWCIPPTGCYGRPGREGRKRRRICIAIWAGMIAAMTLIIVLAVVLSRRGSPREAPSIWVNLTDFPPMPTGVLTIVGPDNSVSKSVCTKPSTLWSCSLPKDQHSSVAPYMANQPTVVMQIQWDNGTGYASKGAEDGRSRRGARVVRRAHIRQRDEIGGFRPQPDGPDLKELWFLGNTTDDIKAENKAGEQTPFYISLLKSTDEPVGLPKLGRRDGGAQIGNQSLAGLLPAPALEADGTPTAATMLPYPVQQPVRLFDRGLPSEHYGFFTHFRRSLFVRSVTILNRTKDGDVPLDENGGCGKNEAAYMVNWDETRVLVQIWTRALTLNASSLLPPGPGPRIGGNGELVRPGTMPYPVTVTLDTHGGNPKRKLVWDWPIDARQRLALDKAELLANDMGAGGTWINPRGAGNAEQGGFDGGSGGCRCEWVNWVSRGGRGI
ncbi:hypothetical protein RJ55_01380 [Drechmeria coniospora]|nr:hypothetical protein RJ55_01380 [Drechmeria coniospora]